MSPRWRDARRPVALGLVGVAVAVTVWNLARDDERPVLPASQLADAVAVPCAGLHQRVADVSDFVTIDELMRRVDRQRQAVVEVSDALGKSRPDAAAAAAYERVRRALATWASVDARLVERLGRPPTPSLGRVVDGLAADATAAVAVDRAVAGLAGRPCARFGDGPRGGDTARRVAVEALVAAGGFGRLVEPAPTCVGSALLEIPFDAALDIERRDPTEPAVRHLSGVLADCLEFGSTLARIFRGLGYEPWAARCLAEAVSREADWSDLVETVLSGRSEGFESAAGVALEACLR